MRISGSVFVVTGAGNGIGRQVALGLAGRGASVAAVDRDEVGLAHTADLVRGDRTRVSTHLVDITDTDSVAALPGEILERHHVIDGLVNIAGVIHRFAPFTELSAADAHRIMNVNFTATVTMCRTFLPILLDRPEANLTNMSSLAALLPFATQTLYGASKGAVKLFSEGLYAELFDTDVHVVTVFPGNVDTNLTGNSGVSMLDAQGKKVRSTSPEAAAAKIVDGIAHDRYRVIIGSDARILDTMARLSPRRATRFVARQIKSVL